MATVHGRLRPYTIDRWGRALGLRSASGRLADDTRRYLSISALTTTCPTFLPMASATVTGLITRLRSACRPSNWNLNDRFGPSSISALSDTPAITPLNWYVV